MKSIFVLILLFAVSQIAIADITVNCGWEGTATILGMYPDTCIIASIATDPVHSGTQSLYVEDNAPSGTPQAFVAWIVGLQNGDEVTGSFWRYDMTPDAAPKCRIWGHWNDDPNDITGHNGSAGGNSDYGPGTGWDETSYTWTVVDGHTGLVIECRTYSSAGDIVWIDDMTIIAPDHATIYIPGTVAIENSTWADIKASF
ncbi:MAG: hypothetical protein GQ565_12535 [Candidatus Aegiribacteria sp.]|nr:hypothetical protein [Candidatus Aegiribacteria sp.]